MREFTGLKTLGHYKIKEKKLKPCQWQDCKSNAVKFYCKPHSYDARLESLRVRRAKSW